MFIHKIVEKQWIGVDGETLYKTKYHARSINEVTSVTGSTHPHLELQGVFSSPVSGVNVQMRNTKTGQHFWYIVA